MSPLCQTDVSRHVKRRPGRLNLPIYKEPEPTKAGFESLPVEIVAVIFGQLHWQDLLNARRTCTLFYNASKAREIWENLLRTHAAAAHRPPTILDKPMRFHSAGKLEERFLRWMKTEATWLDERPLNEKEIPDPHEFQYSHLLRGGRWLICSDFGGEVLYCDLESPENGFVPLIPYPFPTKRGSMTMMAVEEDPETENLTFNIALVHTLFEDWLKQWQHKVSGDSRVDVWSGRVVLDEDGEATRLEVEHLACVPLPLYLGRPLFGVSLRGSFIAFNVEWRLAGLPGLEKCDAIIIDWKSHKSKGSCFRRKTVTYRHRFAELGQKVEVKLLPGNRLLTALPPCLCIFDHSFVPWSSEERPALIDMSVPNQHARRLNVPGSSIQYPCGFSQLFPLPDNEYRMVFNTLERIRGLVLRYKGAGGFEATVLELLDWCENMDRSITEYRADFSYNCGVARSKSGSLLRARFTWPDQKPSFETGISTLTGKPKETPLVMNMDVASGRLSWIAAESGRVYASD